MSKPDWVQRVKRGDTLHDQVEAEVTAYNKLQEEYEKKVESLTAGEDKRHGSRNDDYDVKRRLQVYADVFGDTPQTYPTPTRKPPEERQPMSNEEWMVKDRRDNILHILWKSHYWSNHRDDLDQVEWNEVVIARALLRLLAYIPTAYNYLAPMYTERDRHTIPTHEDAIRFISKYMDTGVNHDVNTVDEHMMTTHEYKPEPPKAFIPIGTYAEGERFLSLVFDEVPGLKRAVYKVLRRYREQVLFQRRTDINQHNAGGKEVEGYLPFDDELGPEYEVLTWETMIDSLGLSPDYQVMEMEEVAMELATSAVRGGMPVTKAYKLYGVPRNQLTSRVKEMGIPLKRGKRSSRT